jgi:exopolysaccharide biosynthesis polyprenyl glycosylphosphotransferase
MVLTESMLSDATAVGLKARARSRRHARKLEVLGLLATDLVLTSAATLIALNGRQGLPIFANAANDVDNLVRPLALAILLGWLVSIALAGGYVPKQIGVGTVEYRRILGASFGMAAALGISAYLLQYPLSRGFYFLLFVVGIPLLVLGRLLLRRIIHRMRRRGRFMMSVLIAGDLDHVDDVAAVLDRERWLGYEVVGALTGDATEDRTTTGIPIFGNPDDAVAILNATGANAVIFAEGSFRRGRHFNEMARALEDSHAQMIVVPSLTDISAARMDVRPVAGIPLVHIEAPRARAAGHVWKRVFDVVGSSLLILLGSPILAAVAVAIRLDDRGPVLFKQVRAGLKGDPFECFKFRSMALDAEARLAQLQSLNESDGVLFKMADDPRVTKVGRFIRRYSLDELPQLFNVWLGDMSLVGPRPALLSETERYKDHVMRRLDVRPGMTGLWQVSGRSDLSWDDTVRLDLYYVDNWSMLQDLSILMKTFGAVVRSRGAY